LEALQQINTVNFTRAVVALIEEVEREEVFLANISITVAFWELRWRLWEDSRLGSGEGRHSQPAIDVHGGDVG
jgi:hypothetical protein